MTRTLLTGLLLIAAAFTASIALGQWPDPARITITTNGTDATVEVSGGDVGYPGPSQVVIERDGLGWSLGQMLRLATGVCR